MTVRSSALASSKVIHRLGGLIADRGLASLSARLQQLRVWVSSDMHEIERALSDLPLGDSAVESSAQHLLACGGKRLRPMCVSLAARLGAGFTPAAREIAIASELIHNASLLHDDVIDDGQQRRGRPAARVLFGNAASVIGGNWLLVEALQRVAAVGVGDALERGLGMIGEMVEAEALQLDLRGKCDVDRADYFRVIEGKTAALFAWALYAGGLAAGLPPEQCEALEEYGARLGLAFQLIDDLLDYTGESAVMGKQPFTDLREGKATYPFLLALERDESLRHQARRILERSEDAPLPGDLSAQVLDALERTGALREARALAEEEAQRAVSALARLPMSRAREALVTVAEAVLRRES